MITMFQTVAVWCCYIQLLLGCLRCEENSSWIEVQYINESNSNSTLSCQQGKIKCVFMCSGENSCSNVVINCNNTQDCNIICNDKRSCYNSSLNGSTSQSLTINLSHDTDGDAAASANIICPTTGEKDSCTIRCFKNCNKINIFATNGS